MKTLFDCKTSDEAHELIKAGANVNLRNDRGNTPPRGCMG